MIYSESEYGMTQCSNNKEGVFEFIKFTITADDYYEGFDLYLSPSKAHFEKKLENYLKNEEESKGKQIASQGKLQKMYIARGLNDYIEVDFIEIDLRGLFEKLLSNLNGVYRESIEYNIFVEVAMPFFNGEKSAEEVADDIISRISIYRSEHE